MTTRRVLRGVALLATMAVPTLAPARAVAPTSDQEPAGTNWVGVAQTVVAGATPTGEINGTPRLFTEVSADGRGLTSVKVPMSASGLRELTGCPKPRVVGGQAAWNLRLVGTTTRQTVSDFAPGRLPVTVTAGYTLDGKPISARDVVGRSGQLKVTYRIENTTTAPTQVSFTNVFGAPDERTVRAPIPLAATIEVGFPAGYTRIQAQGAGASLDTSGTGAVSAQWALLLFDPLGGVSQTVSYEARVTDAAIPSATVGVAPVPAMTPTSTSVSSSTTQSASGSATQGGVDAPAAPTVTVGEHLANLQADAQARVQDLAAKASAVLTDLQRTAVPAAQQVAATAATESTALAALSADAQKLSAAAGDAAATSGQAATDAAGLATGGDAALSQLEQLPDAVKDTDAYRQLHAQLVQLQASAAAHASNLALRSGADQALEATAASQAAGLKASATAADALSAKAAETATTLAAATPNAKGAQPPAAAPAPAQPPAAAQGSAPSAGQPPAHAPAQPAANGSAQAKPPTQAKPGAPAQPPKQTPGGAQLQSAVNQLDATITDAGNRVDASYANLLALNARSDQNPLPLGSASGATVQTGSIVLTLQGATNAPRQANLVGFVGGLVLFAGIGGGIGVHRIRRGLPSVLTPKRKPAQGR